MNNQELIKSAHIWGLAVLLACGLWAFAGTELQGQQNQNQNQNSNQNQNQNTNTANANSPQNENANTRDNRNTNTGDQTGMAGLSSQDRDFMMDAAMGGMMEVHLGRWALQLGASEAVKQFARRMVDDHSKANAELMALASSKGITLPTELDNKHQGQVRKLTVLSGAAFDRAYAKRMVSDHNKKVSAFEKQSTKGADADIKAFADKTLPTVREHLQMAQALSPAEGGNSNSNSNANSNSNSNSNRP